MDEMTDTFPSLSYREHLHRKYGLTGKKDSEIGDYKSYSLWDRDELWQWFAYHYGWFWFRRRQFDPTCPVDPKGNFFDPNLVKLAYEAYCSEYCARCRHNLRRGEKPCENHRPPTIANDYRVRTTEEIAEVERKVRQIVYNLERWEEANKQAFDPIAAVHRELGITASERAQERDEALDTPAAEKTPAQVRRERDSYIKGEFVFPGQWYDDPEILEAALENIQRSNFSPHRSSSQRSALPRIATPLNSTQRNDLISTPEEIPPWVIEPEI